MIGMFVILRQQSTDRAMGRWIFRCWIIGCASTLWADLAIHFDEPVFPGARVDPVTLAASHRCFEPEVETIRQRQLVGSLDQPLRRPGLREADYRLFYSRLSKGENLLFDPLLDGLFHRDRARLSLVYRLLWLGDRHVLHEAAEITNRCDGYYLSEWVHGVMLWLVLDLTFQDALSQERFARLSHHPNIPLDGAISAIKRSSADGVRPTSIRVVIKQIGGNARDLSVAGLANSLACSTSNLDSCQAMVDRFIKYATSTKGPLAVLSAADPSPIQGTLKRIAGPVPPSTSSMAEALAEVFPKRPFSSKDLDFVSFCQSQYHHFAPLIESLGESDCSGLERYWQHRSYLDLEGLKVDDFGFLRHFSHVTELNLRNNLLTSLDGLPELPNLRYLTIGYNYLSRQPDLRRFDNLEYVEMDDHRIPRIDLDLFPDSVRYINAVSTTNDVTIVSAAVDNKIVVVDRWQRCRVELANLVKAGAIPYHRYERLLREQRVPRPFPSFRRRGTSEQDASCAEAMKWLPFRARYFMRGPLE